MLNVKKLLTNMLRTTPVGEVIAYAGASVPTGWLRCDGSAVSRTTYAKLFAVIGTTFGTGDGSTTFNLPDLAGRVPLGYSSGHSLGSKGGSEYIQQHSHSFTNPTINSTSGTHKHDVIAKYTSKKLTVGTGTYQTRSDGTSTVTNGSVYMASGQGGHGHTYSANGSVGNINNTGLSTGSSGNMMPFLTISYLIYVGGVLLKRCICNAFSHRKVVGAC